MNPKTESEEGKLLKRYAFILRLNPGVAEAYEKAHREVWPEMLALLKSVGISEYSIYPGMNFSSLHYAVLTLRPRGAN